MARLYHLKIQHFRGIESFEQTFETGITCIIGRGDSGKSTILEAIAFVFSQSWSIHLNDSDFFRCDTSIPIIIEGTIVNVPDELISKFDSHLRGISKDGRFIDDMELEDADNDNTQTALTIQLKVTKDLEPSWSVVSNNGIEPSQIKANDRAKLNVFAVSDFTDRHFSLNKGNPLYSLYKQLDNSDIIGEENRVLEVIREAKDAFDSSVGAKFDVVILKIKDTAGTLGLPLNEMKAMLDHRDIAISENKVSIHENGIPFRLKGKGSKRLLSLAIQLALTQPSGVILIDEIEQGLEPDRVQHLVNVLAKNSDKQIIITTHSSNVITEIPCNTLFIMRNGAGKLLHVEGELQGSIRKNPEAFFAKKVLVCEGATELGFCRALNNFRISQNLKSATCNGVRFADGTGSKMAEYVKGFNDLKYDTALFCDSDAESLNTQKSSFSDVGIQIIDCDDNLALEQQVFCDVSWDTIKELIMLAVQKIKEDDNKLEEEAMKSVYDRTNSCLQNKMTSMNDWYSNENKELRSALGLAAKRGEWYKRQSYGEMMGDIILSHYDELSDRCILKTEIDAISKWIDS